MSSCQINAEMDEIITKLITLSKRKHKSEDDDKKFKEFVESLDYEQMESLLSERIFMSDASQIVNILFLGLSLKQSSQRKRVQLFQFLLEELQTKDIPAKSINSIVSWLVVEVGKLIVPHLIRVCDLCVDYLTKTESPQHCSWKDLMPKILSLLIEKKEVDHYGSEMSGEQYKCQVVTTLTQAKWNESILSPLADMFIHIPLTGEEHIRIVAKFTSCLSSVKPSALPPLVHNLLIFTKSSGAVQVLFALNQYYTDHLYSLDIAGSADIQRDVKEITESEGVSLYHVEEMAKEKAGISVQVVRSAKASVPAPELWLQPFLLASLLALSNIPPNGTQILDTLKAMIIRLMQEDEELKESDWLRKVETATCDIEKVFTRLIKSNICGQTGVLGGLVSLSMSLLGHKGKEKRVWKLGRMIAVNLSIKHPYVAGALISTVTDSVLSSPDVSQYTDCLAELCDTSPMTILESPQVVNRLLEVLPDLPEVPAHRIVSAIISLIRVSHKIRDSLILVLRKSLFVHNVNTRKVAVTGFLQLLKRLHIKGMSSLSQNSFQVYTCPSVFTQTCLDVHSQQASTNSNSNNEGICLEVVNVLKRCFMQQLEVKICLYEGVNRALIRNPELCLPVSEIFLHHLAEYYEPEDDVVPPLKLDRVITLSQGEVVVLEPLGHLVFVVQQIVVSCDHLMSSSMDEDYKVTKSKLYGMLDSLVRRFAKCTPKHLELEEESENNTEAKVKEERLGECLQITEALIGYFVSKWDVSINMEGAQNFLALYRSHSALCDFAKNLKVVKKETEGKKKGGGTQTQGSQGGAKKTVLFTLPKTVFNFETVIRLLELIICETVDWCADDVLTDLHGRRPLRRYAMNTALNVLTKAKDQLEKYKSRSMFPNLTNLGTLLFTQMMTKLPKALEFDPSSAVTAIEAFSLLFSIIISHFKSKLSKFLSEVCNVDESEGLNTLLEKVVKVYLKILGQTLDQEEADDEDPARRKLLAALISGVEMICLELPVSGTCVQKALTWLTDVAERKFVNPPSAAKTLLSLLLRLNQRAKGDSAFFDNLALQLCELYGTVNDVEVEKPPCSYALVTEENKVVVMPLLCASLQVRLTSLDWLIQRTKAEYLLANQAETSASSSPTTSRHKLKRKEKETVVQAGLMCATAQGLTTIRCQESGEALCKTLHRLYSSLSGLTKYYQLRSSGANPAYQEARFGRLVKLAASHLSTQVADFLLFIESVEDIGNGEKKRLSSKVLRMAKKQTLYIPKLVSELENFTKCVTQLSVKCKDPTLTTNLKLTTTRDFRLNTKRLEEVMKRQLEDSEDETDTTASTSVSNQSVQSKKGDTSVAASQTKGKKKGTQTRKKRKT